jgi:hypothetical protein
LWALFTIRAWQCTQTISKAKLGKIDSDVNKAVANFAKEALEAEYKEAKSPVIKLGTPLSTDVM